MNNSDSNIVNCAMHSRDGSGEPIPFHRHCQATVCSAYGANGDGLTWSFFTHDEDTKLSNLPINWKDLFTRNRKNITEDLRSILELIDNVASLSVRQVRLNGITKYPDVSGIIDLGTISSKGSVNSIIVNGTSHAPNDSGAIDLGNFLTSDSNYVKKDGDTLTGFLTLHDDPTNDMHAATKGYVDEEISKIEIGVGGDSHCVIDGTYYDDIQYPEAMTDLTIPSNYTEVRKTIHSIHSTEPRVKVYETKHDCALYIQHYKDNDGNNNADPEAIAIGYWLSPTDDLCLWKASPSNQPVANIVHLKAGQSIYANGRWATDVDYSIRFTFREYKLIGCSELVNQDCNGGVLPDYAKARNIWQELWKQNGTVINTHGNTSTSRYITPEDVTVDQHEFFDPYVVPEDGYVHAFYRSKSNQDGDQANFAITVRPVDGEHDRIWPAHWDSHYVDSFYEVCAPYLFPVSKGDILEVENGGITGTAILQDIQRTWFIPAKKSSMEYSGAAANAHSTPDFSRKVNIWEEIFKYEGVKTQEWTVSQNDGSIILHADTISPSPITGKFDGYVVPEDGYIWTHWVAGALKTGSRVNANLCVNGYTSNALSHWDAIYDGCKTDCRPQMFPVAKGDVVQLYWNPTEGFKGEATLAYVDRTYFVPAKNSSSNSVSGTSNPVGTVISWMGESSNIPEGYLLCDGREVSQTEYFELYSVISDKFGTASEGNFKLPKLDNEIYLQGNTSSGEEVSEKLPNITGHAYKIKGNKQDTNSFTGVFQTTSVANDGLSLPGSATNGEYFYLNFDASKSSSTYQNNAAVTPKSLTTLYLICYKQVGVGSGTGLESGSWVGSTSIISCDGSCGFPSDKTEEFTIELTQDEDGQWKSNWFTAPENGWFVIRHQSVQENDWITASSSAGMFVQSIAKSETNGLGVTVPVSKGNTVHYSVRYKNDAEVDICKFIYANDCSSLQTRSCMTNDYIKKTDISSSAQTAINEISSAFELEDVKTAMIKFLSTYSN